MDCAWQRTADFWDFSSYTFVTRELLAVFSWRVTQKLHVGRFGRVEIGGNLLCHEISFIAGQRIDNYQEQGK